MAHNDISEYPAIHSGSATATPLDIGSDGVGIRFAWLLLSNDSGGALTPTITGHGGTTTIINFTFDLADGAQILIPGFYSADGLRVAGNGIDVLYAVDEKGGDR